MFKSILEIQDQYIYIEYIYIKLPNGVTIDKSLMTNNVTSMYFSITISKENRLIERYTFKKPYNKKGAQEIIDIIELLSKRASEDYI